jgi:4-alpha-glucanotransferase
VDRVRLDHFRGFEAYWEIPGGEKTAVKGKWVKGPGAALFEAVRKALGPLPIVAENLGVITPEVEALREKFGFPGMAILQFAWGSDPQGSTFLPHNYHRRLVVYTGTHDNDTTLGWWRSLDEGTRDLVRAQLVDPDEPMAWALVRLALTSTARLAVVPAQDLLGLGSSARMNTPGVPDGNWTWRAEPGAFDDEVVDRLRGVVSAGERVPGGG